jgi:hypothetical protein
MRFLLQFVTDNPKQTHERLFIPETDNRGKFLTLSLIYICNINSGDKLIEIGSVVERVHTGNLNFCPHD